MDSDKAFQNFLTLYSKYYGKIDAFNEADTRGKIIDTILTDCLGYDKECIFRESPTKSGFIDYELRINGSCQIIIEAKKTGDYFEIPSDFNKRTYKLSGVISSISNLVDAINQVHYYCVDIGCKYAAVFNGHQLVIFAAIALGKPWREGYCYIFRSLDDIKNNFYLIWNMLSFENVKQGSLINYLEKGKSDLTFEKILFCLHNQDENLVRNDLYTYIQPISDFIFSELLDKKRAEVLKACYIYGRSNNPLSSDMKSFFIDKLPHFSQKYKIREII